MATISQPKRYSTGDRLWQVEWVSAFGHDEYGDHDYDLDKWVRKSFTDRDAAIAYAKTIIDMACHHVCVGEIEFESYDDSTCPHQGFWTDCDDGEYFEQGDDIK
jgi:hypothetical protein